MLTRQLGAAQVAQVCARAFGTDVAAVRSVASASRARRGFPAEGAASPPRPPRLRHVQQRRRPLAAGARRDSVSDSVAATVKCITKMKSSVVAGGVYRPNDRPGQRTAPDGVAAGRQKSARPLAADAGTATRASLRRCPLHLERNPSTSGV